MSGIFPLLGWIPDDLHRDDDLASAPPVTRCCPRPAASPRVSSAGGIVEPARAGEGMFHATVI